MALLNAIPINVIEISRDYQTSERAGAGEMFQVSRIAIITDFGTLYPQFDAGHHYYEMEDVVRDLGFDPMQVNYDEV
ncbi:hypothetical protein [Sporomusa aerivorans]|uniref:hypothetical protein n=1 Tax=Sporomusa aerivorans TaxID=204936 RepID=UPI00352AA15D